MAACLNNGDDTEAHVQKFKENINFEKKMKTIRTGSINEKRVYRSGSHSPRRYHFVLPKREFRPQFKLFAMDGNH